MAVLRSAQFYEGIPPVVGGVNTFTLAYTVPAGHRIKLATALATNNGATAHTAQVRVGSTYILRSVSLAANASDVFHPDVIFEPGEQLYVLQVVGASVFYMLSGYIFFI